MTSPVTLFHCTSPCCLGQVPVAAPTVRSLDPEPITRYDSIAMILDSICMLPSGKDLLSEIEAPAAVQVARATRRCPCSAPF